MTEYDVCNCSKHHHSGKVKNCPIHGYQGGHVPRPVYGLNAGLPPTLWNAARPLIGNYPGWRCYNTPAEGVPASWPGGGSGPKPAEASLVVTSIKPDPASVINGSQDAALQKFVSGANPGDYVSLWHEGETSDGIPPATLLAMHRHAHFIINEARPDVHYIQIVAAYTANPHSANYPLDQWIQPGLDVYGIDGYRATTTDTVSSVWGATAQSIRRVAGLSARLAVCECNGITTGMSEWFAASYKWAVNHHCELFFPFYGAKYPWDPTDTVTIAELKRECALSAA